MKRPYIFTKCIASISSAIFFLNIVASAHPAFAQIEPMFAPATGVLSTGVLFKPPVLCGIKTYPQDPLRFDFIIDSGDQRLSSAQLTQSAEKLIRYFLACLTTPEQDLWVNLSPYENNRIIPDSLGQTEAGRDLLEQDYLLKQIASSLIYPETALGKAFWDRVYKKAYERYGTTQIPVDTFNKIWIVPEKATIYQTADRAVITSARLKVMLEKDFLAEQKNKSDAPVLSQATSNDANNFSSDIVRDLILPEIEKEVNEGKNFSALRQIFFSLILATWFKKSSKTTFLSQTYVDQKKIAGIDLVTKGTTEHIYHDYVKTFQKGVFDFIKVEQDPYLHKSIPRKYFSGGFFLRKSTEWMDERNVGSSSLIDQAASKIYTNSNAIQVQLAPKPDASRGSSSIVTDKKGLRKFFVIAAFSLMVGVMAPFSNLFAGTANDRYVGEKYGNYLYQTEDGRAYSVVPKWGNPDKATGTVSGIGAAAMAYADEIGMNVPQGTVLYWDVINSIAKTNHISPESGYLIQPGDTIWISNNVEKAAQSFSQTRRTARPSQTSGESRPNSQNISDLSGGQHSDFNRPNGFVSSDSQGNDAVDSVMNDSISIQKLYGQMHDLQKQIDSLEIQLKTYLPPASDTSSADTSAGNPPPPPPPTDSVKIELARANQNIAFLLQQLDDLKKKKKKITVDFERKVEAKLNIKDGVSTVVSKGGDAKFTFRYGNTKLETNFKFEGSMVPGADEQKTYIKEHFLLEQDSVLGQPFKARMGLNLNHATDPYFFGFDTYPQKLFSKTLYLSAGADAYFPMVSEVDDENNIIANSRQRVYIPRIKLDWKPNSKMMLSLKGEGVYSQDPFTKSVFSDQEYTLSFKIADKKGDNTISLVQGFKEPKIISNLTSLTTDPGPYRIGYERGLKVLGNKGAIGGYWAFDKDFQTQGAKVWVKFNGPLNYSRWLKEGFGTSQSGLVFASETDLAMGSKLFFDDPDSMTTYGNMGLGVTLKRFLGSSGDLYFGLRSDFNLQGSDFKSSRGYLTKPRLNIEYAFTPGKQDVFTANLGLTQGHPTVGAMLHTDPGNRFVIAPEANFYYLGKNSPEGDFLGDVSIAAGTRLTDEVFLWATPRMLWPSESNIMLGGSLELLINNYGIEFFKDFSADPDLLRNIGYLPHGYDWRIGPIVNFPSFSGGIFYGQDGANGVIGIRAALKINKSPKDARAADIKNQFMKTKNEKHAEPKGPGSSSLLLSKENIFSQPIGESNLSSWTLLKERLKHAQVIASPETQDPQLSSHVIFINAFGNYEDVVLQIQEAVEDAKPQQLAYLTVELRTEKTTHHIAALTTAAMLRNDGDYHGLDEILLGIGDSPAACFLYIAAEEILEPKDILLKTFLLKDSEKNHTLFDEALKESAFINLAKALIQRYPKQRIFITISSEDKWLQSQIQSYLADARMYSFTKFNNTLTIQAVLSRNDKKTPTVANVSSPITSELNGGINLKETQIDIQFDDHAMPITNPTTNVLPLFDAEMITGFVPVSIQVIPFSGFYSFLTQPSSGFPQIASAQTSAY